MAKAGNRQGFRRIAAFFVAAILGIAGVTSGLSSAQATGVCGYVRVWPGDSVPVGSTCTSQNHPRCLPGTGATVWPVDFFVCRWPS